MPLWKIYHNPSVLSSASQRQTLATAITQLYVSLGLPDFYVNVHFYPIPAAQFFTGGREISSTVGVEILHVARQWDPKETERATKFKDAVDEILRPYTMDQGLHLEYCVLEGPAALWRINGIDPPEAFAEGDERAEKNRERLREDHERRH